MAGGVGIGGLEAGAWMEEVAIGRSLVLFATNSLKN